MADSTGTWVVPTIQTLYTYLERGVVDLANTKDLGAGQSDRFTQAMADATNKVRQRIASVPGYVVSATANSVPFDLLDHVARVILLAIQGAYPALGLTEDQKKACEASWKFVEDIRPDARGCCDYRPPMPSDAVAGNVQGVPKANVVKHTPRSMTARSLRGLTLGVGSGDHDHFDSDQLY